MLRDSVGNQLSNARSISLTAKTQTFRDGIGGSDTEDFYRFTIGSARDFSLNLNGLIANADVQLLNQSGSVIASSTQAGNQDESIGKFLVAGTYYIRVFSSTPNQTVYNLNLFANTDPGGTFQTASPIQVSSNTTRITGALDPGANDFADYYRFTVTQQSTATFGDGFNYYSSLSPNFRLFDSQGQAIFPFPPYRDAPPTAYLDPGTYYISLSGFTGGYSFYVDAVASPDPGDTPATARSLTVGANPIFINDEIFDIDDLDYYRFTLQRSSTLRLRLNLFTPLNNVNLDLLDNQGNVISPSFSGFDTISPGFAYALNAGTYYIRVDDAQGIYGPYGLSIFAKPDAGNTRSTALSINPSQQPNGDPFTVEEALNATTDPEDYYRFTLNRRSNFTLNVAGAIYDDFEFPVTSDVSVELLNSAGTVITSTTTANSGFIQQLLDAGTYYVRVLIGSGVAAGYTVDFSTTQDGGDTQAKARFVNANSSVVDRISPLFDPNDYYSFFVSGRNHVQLNLLDGVSNLGVQLLNQSGQVIASSSTAGSSDTINRFLNTGTYYVRVFSPTGDSGEYRLNIATIADVSNTLGSARSIQPIADGIVQSNRIEDADPTDYYRFFLSQSGVLDLRLLGLSADLNVQLLDGAGRVIVAGNNPGTNPEAFNRLLSRGTYYIQVLQGGSGANSNYELALNLYAIEGNSFATATRLALTPATATRPTGFTTRRWIDSTQPQDFYKFTIGTDTNFKLALMPGTSNVDLQLHTNTGTLISSSSNTGLLADEIIAALAAGTYYLRVVQPVPGAGSSYSLSGTALV